MAREKHFLCSQKIKIIETITSFVCKWTNTLYCLWRLRSQTETLIRLKKRLEATRLACNLKCELQRSSLTLSAFMWTIIEKQFPQKLRVKRSEQQQLSYKHSKWNIPMFTCSFATDRSGDTVTHKRHGTEYGAVSIGLRKTAQGGQSIITFSISCCILRPTNVLRGTNDDKRG